MTKKLPPKQSESKAQFMPNMENFRTSLSYEGMVLKADWTSQGIEVLKRKYAR